MAHRPLWRGTWQVGGPLIPTPSPSVGVWRPVIGLQLTWLLTVTLQVQVRLAFTTLSVETHFSPSKSGNCKLSVFPFQDGRIHIFQKLPARVGSVSFFVVGAVLLTTFMCCYPCEGYNGSFIVKSTIFFKKKKERNLSTTDVIFHFTEHVKLHFNVVQSVMWA